jgi:hypothetical protein
MTCDIATSTITMLDSSSLINFHSSLNEYQNIQNITKIFKQKICDIMTLDETISLVDNSIRDQL